MKYTVWANGENISVPEFVFEETDGDMRAAIENMAQATAAAIYEFTKNYTGETPKAKKLFEAVIDYAGLISEELFKEQLDDYRYEDKEDEFITWIFNQGYDDAYAFADNYTDVKLQLAFDATCADVEVYLADENGQRLETIGEIPSFLFMDEPETAAAMCVEYTAIAVLAFDKLYTHENNPLRRLPVTDLERRIRAEVL